MTKLQVTFTGHPDTNGFELDAECRNVLRKEADVSISDFYLIHTRNSDPWQANLTVIEPLAVAETMYTRLTRLQDMLLSVVRKHAPIGSPLEIAVVEAGFLED